MVPAAGTPPPGGTARFLEAGQGLFLGAGGDPEHPTGTEDLPAGSTLRLFTDGLVEAPGVDIEVSLEGLRRHATSVVEYPLEEFCDQILPVVPTGSTDDTALLALRVPPRAGRWVPMPGLAGGVG